MTAPGHDDESAPPAPTHRTDPPNDHESATRTPNWAKAFWITGAVLAILVIVMLLSGHGPGRHTNAGLQDHAPAATIAEPRR